MNRQFCAYVAGLVDSEGCVTVSAFKKSSSYTTVIPYVFITNTYLPILKKVQKVFGGKIQISVKRKSYLKTCYILYFSRKQAIDFLRQIQPFIRLKSKQMQLLFKLASLMNHTSNKNRKSNRYILRQPNENSHWHVVKAINPVIIRREQRILLQIRRLNKRGI